MKKASFGYSVILGGSVAAALCLSTLTARSGIFDWFFGGDSAWEHGEFKVPLARNNTEFIRTKSEIESRTGLLYLYVQCVESDLELVAADVNGKSEDKERHNFALFHIGQIEVEKIRNMPISELQKKEENGGLKEIFDKASDGIAQKGGGSWMQLKSLNDKDAGPELTIVDALREISRKNEGGMLIYFDNWLGLSGMFSPIDFDSAKGVVDTCRTRGFKG